MRALLPLTLALLATACSNPARSTAAPSSSNTSEVSMQDAHSIANKIGVTFPKGARVEHADLIEGRDDAARVALVMSAADWTAWKSALAPSDAPPFSAEANFHLGPDDTDWTPSKATGLLTTQVPWRAGKEALNLGYAPTGENKVRVFLFWHQL